MYICVTTSKYLMLIDPFDFGFRLYVLKELLPAFTLFLITPFITATPPVHFSLG